MLDIPPPPGDSPEGGRPEKSNSSSTRPASQKQLPRGNPDVGPGPGVNRAGVLHCPAAHLLQIGRLLNFLEQSGLAETTYVMLTGDNGPALFSQESEPVPKQVRSSTTHKAGPGVLSKEQGTASRCSTQDRAHQLH